MIPPLVENARSAAARGGFTGSCTVDVGRLLMALAATVDQGIIGEVGTGMGVGSAWLAAGMREHVRLATVEIDLARAIAARAALADDPRIEVISGDWSKLASRGPFGVLFIDGGVAKTDTAVDAFVDAIVPGGIVVMDDLTPIEHWPAEWKDRVDRVRERWLKDARFAAAEIGVGYDKQTGRTPAAAIVAVRR